MWVAAHLYMRIQDSKMIKLRTCIQKRLVISIERKVVLSELSHQRMSDLQGHLVSVIRKDERRIVGRHSNDSYMCSYLTSCHSR